MKQRNLEFCLLLLLLLLYTPVVFAETKKNTREWAVSWMLGLHAPKLKALNEGEFKSPFMGEVELENSAVDLVDIDGVDNVVPITNDLTRAEVRTFSELEPFDPGPFIGVNFVWKPNERWNLLIGWSMMEMESQNQNRVQFPLQGTLNEVDYFRQARINYTDLILGFRRLLYKNRKTRFYGVFTFHQLFDIDYREDHRFSFTEGQSEGFKRIFIQQAQTTAHLLIELGFGIEYEIFNWMTVEWDAGYMFGTRKFHLKDLTSRDDFTEEDRFDAANRLPPMVQNNRTGNVMYLAEDGSRYRNLELSFEGWKTMIKLTLHY